MPHRRARRHCLAALLAAAALPTGAVDGGAMRLRYFPVGPIYDYRWKLLALALEKTRAAGERIELESYAQPELAQQHRGMRLTQEGKIDVLSFGVTAEREAGLLPVRVDIMRGMVGFRVLLIRAGDQARIAAMDVAALKQLRYGLNSQWADVPIMRANGFEVAAASGYESLFAMLAAGRFDAFPRGLNEASRELELQRRQFPQLVLEQSRALYFPYPVYFWVRQGNKALAARIERGLQLALADGSFRHLFEQYHAKEIAALRQSHRQVLRLLNSELPPGHAEPDTSWWWPDRREGR